jgi:hypothetical protein
MKLETVESLSSAAAAQQTNSPQVCFGYTSAFVFSHSPTFFGVPGRFPLRFFGDFVRSSRFAPHAVNDKLAVHCVSFIRVELLPEKSVLEIVFHVTFSGSDVWLH